MPQISGSAPKKVPKRPEDRPIESRNICGLCFYNVPQGTFLLLLPGFMMLIIGIVMTVWLRHDLQFESGLVPPLGLILVILGGAITVGGVIYWIVMWKKYRPPIQERGRAAYLPEVQLVAVYKLRSDMEDGLDSDGYYMNTISG